MGISELVASKWLQVYLCQLESHFMAIICKYTVVTKSQGNQAAKWSTAFEEIKLLFANVELAEHSDN